MKSYDNKKIYNFKVKHKRKRRTRSAQIWWRTGSGSTWYLKNKRQEYRRHCKEILRKKIQVQDIEFSLYRKTLWWDS